MAIKVRGKTKPNDIIIEEDGITIAQCFLYPDGGPTPTHSIVSRIPVRRIAGVSAHKDADGNLELFLELDLDIAQKHRIVYILNNVLAELDQEA